MSCLEKYIRNKNHYNHLCGLELRAIGGDINANDTSMMTSRKISEKTPDYFNKPVQPSKPPALGLSLPPKLEVSGNKTRKPLPDMPITPIISTKSNTLPKAPEEIIDPRKRLAPPPPIVLPKPTQISPQNLPPLPPNLPQPTNLITSNIKTPNIKTPNITTPNITTSNIIPKQNQQIPKALPKITDSPSYREKRKSEPIPQMAKIETSERREKGKTLPIQCSTNICNIMKELSDMIIPGIIIAVDCAYKAIYMFHKRYIEKLDNTSCISVFFTNLLRALNNFNNNLVNVYKEYEGSIKRLNFNTITVENIGEILDNYFKKILNAIAKNMLKYRNAIAENNIYIQLFYNQREKDRCEKRKFDQEKNFYSSGITAKYLKVFLHFDSIAKVWKGIESHSLYSLYAETNAKSNQTQNNIENTKPFINMYVTEMENGKVTIEYDIKKIKENIAKAVNVYQKIPELFNKNEKKDKFNKNNDRSVDNIMININDIIRDEIGKLQRIINKTTL